MKEEGSSGSKRNVEGVEKEAVNSLGGRFTFEGCVVLKFGKRGSGHWCSDEGVKVVLMGDV